MSLGTDGPQVEFGGFAPWLPIPLDGDVDGLVALVDELFVDDPASAEVKRASAAALAGIGRQVSEQADDEYLPVAAWVLLADEGRRLDPLAVVTFGALQTPPGFTTTDVIEQMCSEVDLYQPPAITDVETLSGPSTLVRLRRYTGEGADQLLSEIISVIWMSRSMDLAFVLGTTPIDDLVLAAHVGDAMVPLAQSVKGLQQS